MREWWTQLKKTFRENFVGLLFRNVGVPARNSIAFSLGLFAALLLLSSAVLDIGFVAIVFGSAVGAVIVLFLLVRPSEEGRVDRFSWGITVIIVLGFGVGALLFQYRDGIIWLWSHALMINTVKRVLLASLFLLGIILGFFVVRNWSKDQKEFVTSLTAVFGGAFVATLLGEADIGVTRLEALALYSGGFTLSGSLNLVASALLVANYTNKHSMTSRAVIDFLYGSDKAKAIDEYFLKNFKEDPDYAKRLLTDTVNAYREVVRREFAERMQARLGKRLKPPDSKVGDKQIKDQESVAPSYYYYRLLSVQCKTTKDHRPRTEEELRQEGAEGKHEADSAPNGERELSKDDPILDVTFEKIDRITAEMFRVGVTMRWQDMLEYLVAPGEFKKSFPYFGSVAGLALLSRRAIVMDRDKNKKFRAKDFDRGRCPTDIEQPRGLDEIDFLSYISIPVVSRLGKPGEIGLGVVNIDTKLFVTTTELKGKLLVAPDALRVVYGAKIVRSKLTTYANGLYEENDEDVKFLIELTDIIVPVLELYLKCRQGAT